jgi:hypothetical protein
MTISEAGDGTDHYLSYSDTPNVHQPTRMLDATCLSTSGPRYSGVPQNMFVLSLDVMSILHTPESHKARWPIISSLLFAIAIRAYSITREMKEEKRREKETGRTGYSPASPPDIRGSTSVSARARRAAQRRRTASAPHPISALVGGGGTARRR